MFLYEHKLLYIHRLTNNLHTWTHTYIYIWCARPKFTRVRNMYQRRTSNVCCHLGELWLVVLHMENISWFRHLPWSMRLVSENSFEYLVDQMLVLVTQSCLTLCDPMDCSSPGSSIHGILQARILEWVAIPFSRGSFWTQGSNPDLLHCRQILYHLSHTEWLDRVKC